MSGDEIDQIRRTMALSRYGGPSAMIRALDEAGFVIVRKGLHQSLRRMVDTFRPFTLKPVGAPHNQVRCDQDEQIAAHAEAKALAYPTGHLRDAD